MITRREFILSMLALLGASALPRIGKAHHGIALDSMTTSVETVWSHTVGPGKDRVMVVACKPGVKLNVTYAGRAFSKVADGCYYLVDPPEGKHEFHASAPGPFCSMSFNGVDQNIPFDTALRAARYS